MGKLTAEFVSKRDLHYSLEIANDNIEEDREIVLAADPVHIIVANQEMKYTGLRSTECQINILSKTDLVELYTEDILGTTVIVKRNDGVVIFAGFLEPSQWNQPCAPGEWNEMQVVAIDAWSAMKQYPMYVRKAAPFSEWLNDMQTVINDAFESTGITITTFDNSEEFAKTFVVNNDVLMPDDLYAEEGFDKFPSYGDLLKEIGMAINRTFVMIGKSLEIYNVDDVQDFWNEHAEQDQLDTSISVEIVPSKRLVSYKTDWPPQQDQPKVKEGGNTTEGYFPGSISTKYKDKYVYFFFARNGCNMYWENYETIPFTRAGTSEQGANCVMGVTYADERKDRKIEANEFFLGCSAISSPIHPRLSNLQAGLFEYVVEADVFKNPDYLASDNYKIVPQLWKVGLPEAQGVDSNFSSSTIALEIDGQIVSPTTVSTDFESDKVGWQHCTFRFTVNNTEARNLHGQVKIVLRSPQLSATSGYRFAKNVKFVYNTPIGRMEQKMNVNNKLTGEDLQLDFGINTFNSGEPNKGTIQGNTPSSVFSLMQRIVQQYCKPRRQWSICIPHPQYDPRRKVKYNGIICTQVGSDWNLYDDEVQARILESFETN